MTVTETPVAKFDHPGLANPTPAPATDLPADRTIKADILAELTRSTRRPNVTFLVPDRPGWSVDFDVQLDADLLARQTKAVRDEKTGEPDIFELALRIVASQCRGLRRNGELIELDGKPLTFTSPAIAELYDSTDVTVTVRNFYGNDVVVSSVFQRIQEEAGAGSLDPTDESSA